MEIQSPKRKVINLGEIHDPSMFARLMREKGYQVTVNEVSIPNRKVVEMKGRSEDCQAKSWQSGKNKGTKLRFFSFP